MPATPLPPTPNSIRAGPDRPLERETTDLGLGPIQIALHNCQRLLGTSDEIGFEPIARTFPGHNLAPWLLVCTEVATQLGQHHRQQAERLKIIHPPSMPTGRISVSVGLRGAATRPPRRIST